MSHGDQETILRQEIYRLEQELGSPDDPESWLSLKRDRDRYREALERIANHPWDVMSDAESELQSVKEIARAAVGGDPE